MKSFIIVVFFLFTLQVDNAVIAENIKGFDAYSFQRQGLSYASMLYGPPMVEVKKVILTHTSGLPYTNITDEENGLFTIYLSRRPHEYAFYGQLAHEIGHLLNARLYDVYAEGLNGVFAEKLLKKQGKDWSGWEKYYRQGGDHFYALAYYMMREVEAIAGYHGIQTLLSYAEPSSSDPNRMYININGWLKSLPINKKEKIRSIILKHAPALQNTMGSMIQKSAFQLPE